MLHVLVKTYIIIVYFYVLCNSNFDKWCFRLMQAYPHQVLVCV